MNILSKHPEIAGGVGEYISAFGLTEMLCASLFAKIINDNGKVAHAILHQFRNITDRIQVIEDVAVEINYSELTIVRKLISRVRCANSLRNELAHGLYGLENNGNVVIHTWVTSKHRKQKQINVDIAYLSELNANISELNIDLQKYCFPQKL